MLTVLELRCHAIDVTGVAPKGLRLQRRVRHGARLQRDWKGPDGEPKGLSAPVVRLALALVATELPLGAVRAVDRDLVVDRQVGAETLAPARRAVAFDPAKLWLGAAAASHAGASITPAAELGLDAHSDSSSTIRAGGWSASSSRTTVARRAPPLQPRPAVVEADP